MKKNLILALCVPALLLAGCTAVEPDVDQTPESTSAPAKTNVVITARIASPETRVAYFEQQTTDENNNPIRLIHQQWQKDDVLFGCDDEGNPVNLVVDHVDDGVAYLTVAEDCKMPTEGSIHMIYCGEGESGTNGDPWTSACDLALPGWSWDGWIDFSFDGVSSDLCFYEESNVFGVMSADSEVSSAIEEVNGESVCTLSADLVFTNRTAFIGLQGLSGIKMDGVNGISIDRIELSGVQAAAALALVEDENDPNQMKMAFSAYPDAPSSVAIECYRYPDENGKILFQQSEDETPLLLAVFPREGGEETEEIELRAYFSIPGEEGDEMTEYAFTRSLGRREIVAGNYYYIPTKRLSAPIIPVVKVEDASGESPHSFGSLADAFGYVNDSAVDQQEGSENTGVTLTLLRDCRAEDLPTLSGNENCSFVKLELSGHTLTLDGCSLTTDLAGSLWIYGGTLIQPNEGNLPILSSTAEFVAFDEISVIQGGGVSPIIVGEEGEVDIWGGLYSWTVGPLIASSSSQASVIWEGRFNKNPILPSSTNVNTPEGIRIFEDDNYDYKYICIPTSVYLNLAKTSQGVLKTFTTNRSAGTKYYLAKNNTYLLMDGRLVFEEPNWSGESTYSADPENRHKNIFSTIEWQTAYDSQTNQDFKTNYSLFDGWACVLGTGSYYYNRTCSTVAGVDNARFTKCAVKDSENRLWMNILVFPDIFSWPTGLVVENLSASINKMNLDWCNNIQSVPVIGSEDAVKLVNAGCVFLPAAGILKNGNHYSNNIEGRYWLSTPQSWAPILSFSNTSIETGYDNDGGYASVRVGYRCP